MTHVVAEPCVNCKYTECVEVCPVDCFREGENILIIHTEECIDCAACVPACPTSAIFADVDLPAEWNGYLVLARRVQCEWPLLSKRRDPLPEADRWAKVEGKGNELDARPPDRAAHEPRGGHEHE
jgi:ferredoxin